MVDSQGKPLVHEERGDALERDVDLFGDGDAVEGVPVGAQVGALEFAHGREWTEALDQGHVEGEDVEMVEKLHVGVR